jgi:methyl-accepting chemotaxis protein
MQLTQIQIRQVQQSFGKAATKRRFITTLFYDRLFELDPSLRPMFRNLNLEEQGCRFMQMLALVISSLNDPARFKQRLENLGERHLYYGVQREHYTTFGAALLWALEKGLGKDFTPAAREAWRAFYNLVAETAQNGFYATAGK